MNKTLNRQILKANLIFRQVDHLDVSEVCEHLEVDLGQLVSRKIDRANPKLKRKKLTLKESLESRRELNSKQNFQYFHTT